MNLLVLTVSLIVIATSTDYLIDFKVSNSDVLETATTDDIFFRACDSNNNCGAFEVVSGGWKKKGETYSYTYSTDNFVTNLEFIYVVIRGIDDLCLRRITVNGIDYDTPDTFGVNVPVCIVNNNGDICDMMLFQLSNERWTEPSCTFTYDQLYGVVDATTSLPTKSPLISPTTNPSQTTASSFTKYPTDYPTNYPTNYPSTIPTKTPDYSILSTSDTPTLSPIQSTMNHPTLPANSVPETSGNLK